MFKVPKIKVFGVGGAGCYLIDKAIEREISTAEYYVIDDDYGRLQISKCANKIQLIGGDHAGADYDYSQKTAIANKDLIFDSVKGADLIVVVAGMGGGMGSAVPSIIAEIAKENNIIAVAIVVTPFVFEGEKRLKNAERGIQALREKANMTLIMPCEKATSCLPENAPISDVIKLSDEMVIDALKTIVEPITMPAVINLEFEDTVLALKESKNTFFGMGIGKGKEKCIEAVRYAINCPMASATIDKATSVILYVEGGDDLTMDDMQEVATLVNAVTDEKANIFFAANINSKLTGELKVSFKDKMSDVTIDSFAKALHYSLFVGQYDLDDIPATIFEYESEEGIEGEDWCYLFGQLIDLLDDNEITAKRLYKSFMHEFDLLDTFLKLVNLNAEYLSVEELAQAKGKAFGLFDRQMLEDCGIEEE